MNRSKTTLMKETIMARRNALRLLLASAVSLTFLLSTTPAHAATGCSFVAPNVSVTIDPGTTATLKRSGPAIQVNGVNCGTATVTNTDAIVVTGSSLAETFSIDLSGGPLAPGVSTEGSGAAEIELAVDLGTQSAFGKDKLVVLGTGNGDTYRLGSSGINVNNDDDADITGPSEGGLATMNVEVFPVLSAAGNDTISGQGAVAAVTDPVPYPLALDLQGGLGNDTLSGGNYADTITGGPGADVESGGNNDDTFVEDAAANGNDSISGGVGTDDKLDYSARTASLNVSLDGVANDGQPGLELDNVQPDVEELVLGSGDDTFTGAGPGAAQMRVSMGAGTDTINGGTPSEALYGGPGNDTIHGGLGSDLIYGGMGDDHLFGDDGYDAFYEDADDGMLAVTTATGADEIVGGPLEDGVVYANRGAGSYAITLDNVANDGLDSVPGGAAEEGDNVHDDVEDITGDAGGTNAITGSSARNVIQGGIGNDTISALGGDDVVGGSYGNDLIDGGSENDLLNGFFGNDTLLGQAGNDTLNGQGDNDTLSGGPGTDNASGSYGDDIVIEDGTSANGADGLSGGDGIDTLSYKSRTIGVLVDLDSATADDGEDTNADGIADEGDTVSSDFENLEGGSGNDKLTGQLGSAVANRLTGNGGADVLTGNEGDDLLDGGLGADQLNGGAGVDTSTYAGRTTRLRVDIGGAPDGADADNNGTAEEGDSTAADLENLIGGDGPDTLIGSAGNNVLTGNAGQDVLQGLGGLDKLDGGAGTDRLVGGAANDVEHGGLDNDTFTQGPAVDGADDLFGEGGIDLADYSGRTASVAVRLDGLANDGDDGNHDGIGLEESDNVHVDVENVRGSSAADTLVGGDLANKLVGYGGDDLLDGGAGADIFDGGAGIDTVSYELRGGLEPVTVTAGDNAANDGGSGEHDNVLDTVENIRGGQGGDTLTGNASANLLDGADGNDTLDGQGGPDVLQGGAGIDLADYQARSVSVRVTLDDVANDGTDGSLDGISEESDNVKSDVENVWSGSAPDVLVGDADPNKLFGRGGDDQTIDGQGGADLILGEAGNDSGLIGGDGVDVIVGDVGNDDIFEGSAPNGDDDIQGGPGIDEVHYSGRPNPVAIRLDDVANDGDAATNESDNIHSDVEDAVGGAGSDAFQGSNVANNLIGGPGNDGMNGNGGGDTLSGGTGNDSLLGDAGKDTLNGGPGSDTEEGGSEFDTMREEAGANGADTFSDSDQDALVDYSARTANLTVDIDGMADDGAPGEGDNVTLSIPRVTTGSGADTLSGGRPPNTSTWLNGGPGNDTVNAVNGDLIAGGAGNDTLNGGPDHDILVGGPGNDMELGNGGDDWFWEDGECSFPCPPNGADALHGGAGLDRVEYTGRAAAVTVTIDDVADDGATGEMDNVFTDIEDLRGGHGDDTLTGNAFNNRIDGCYGSDAVNGGAGDDTLGGDAECGGISGSDTVHGDDGDDVIYGDGLSQNTDDKPDHLFGDNGADMITGGGAADDMHGGAGKDQFEALDGFVDTIDGGADTDNGHFDGNDVLMNIP